MKQKIKNKMVKLNVTIKQKVTIEWNRIVYNIFKEKQNAVMYSAKQNKIQL